VRNSDDSSDSAWLDRVRTIPIESEMRIYPAKLNNQGWAAGDSWVALDSDHNLAA